MLHDALVVLFATATGFTSSGIVSSLYRLLFPKAADGMGRSAFVGVMVIAGPTVLFEHAARSRREKSWSTTAFWLAVAVAGYWSLAIGLIVLQLALSFQHPS
jgi:hypothetical protein